MTDGEGKDGLKLKVIVPSGSGINSCILTLHMKKDEGEGERMRGKKKKWKIPETEKMSGRIFFVSDLSLPSHKTFKSATVWLT